MKIDDFMLRLAAAQKQAVPGSDASVSAGHSQESFPYWVNRVSAIDADRSGAIFTSDTMLMRVSIEAQLFVGYITEGIDYELVQRVHQYMQDVFTYFRKSPYLKTTEYPTVVGLGSEGVIVERCNGLLQFEGTSRTLGTSFTFSVPIVLQSFPRP